MQRRYEHLVLEHLSPAQAVAAGLRALPGMGSAFASTQAAWRFYRNPRARLRAVAEPLIIEARQAVSQTCDQFVLVAHDWCQLHYNGHESKQDRVTLSQSKDLGYELQTALAISDRRGEPLAPVCLSLRAADGVHCTRYGRIRTAESQLDELAPSMQFVEGLKFTKTAVHIIDAEADSVFHYRQWDQAKYLFVVRADKEGTVRHEGQNRRLDVVHQELRLQNAFSLVREVEYRQQKVQQWIAETTVTLTRAARPNRVGQGPRRTISGPPLTVRLVISELRNEHGQVLAVWYLLTNVPGFVSADVIALWYYWRWRIENYHKLLKSAGQRVQEWQQDTAAAIAKRLVVASMACVVVWKLERDNSPPARELKTVLVRLSGRQMKRRKPFTAPALLAGLWVLLAMLDVLEQYTVDDLRQLAEGFGLMHEAPDTS